MRPSSAETSEPACVKRKMLSTKNSTSWPWPRKYSATVRPERPTRGRAPGGCFTARWLRPHSSRPGAPLVARTPAHVDAATERAVADRHRDRLAGIADPLAAHQRFAGVPRHG